MTTLCLTMIVRNEGRCLARCLQSAKPVVDRMLVLDTGSTDDTVEIAKRHGAEVHHATWTGDFAAARNRALDLAGADWHLILDADEWLDPSTDPQLLRDFMQRPHRVGALRVRSAFDLQGRVEHNDSWITRLLPGHVRYQGRIHEQPVHEAQTVSLPVLVHHDGYRQQQAPSKRARNFTLLQAALQEHPHDAYLHFQMGVQHDIAEEWVQACHHFARSIELGALDQRWGHDLAARHLHALSRSDQASLAVDFSAVAQQRWPDSTDVCFAIGNLCLDLATVFPDQALQTWLPSAEAAWLRCLEIGEDTAHEGHVLGRGSFLAAHNLSVVYEGLGHTQQAQHYAKLARDRAGTVSSSR